MMHIQCQKYIFNFQRIYINYTFVVCFLICVVTDPQSQEIYIKLIVKYYECVKPYFAYHMPMAANRYEI